MRAMSKEEYDVLLHEIITNNSNNPMETIAKMNELNAAYNESNGFVLPILKCCVCGKAFRGFGNNAEPIRKGICCDKCNTMLIIPSRFIAMKASHNSRTA